MEQVIFLLQWLSKALNSGSGMTKKLVPESKIALVDDKGKTEEPIETDESLTIQ